MALSWSQTIALGSVLKPGMRIASMGYPDLVAPLEMLQYIMGDRFKELKYREDSEEICRRHGLKQRLIPDAGSFFTLMESELDIYDIVEERGGEILCDLNHPFSFSPNTLDAYDVVLDVGTVEHCFNIAQAVMNMAGLIKVGGVVIHENPFNWGNHGFYNLNPTWYADFYLSNGFELLDCRLVTKDGRGCAISHTKRFQFVEEEVNVFAMARKVKNMMLKEMVYPTQTKYQKLISDAGISGDLKEVA